MQIQKRNNGRVVLCILFLTNLLITGCDMEALKNKPNVNFTPTAYTAMDDILIPDPPFPYKSLIDKYRFEPIIFRIDHKDEDDFEDNTYIYINPSISTKVDFLDEVAAKWQSRVNKESGSLLYVQKKGTIRLANTDAYELVYTTVGYDDKRSNKAQFIERVYFIPVTDSQVAAIRLVRDVNDDNKTTDFWADWLRFLKSISIGTPSIQVATVIGKDHNTRHYHVRNMSFDIPIGDETKLNIWAIDLNADRKDSWQTDTGEIQVKYSIADGFEESKKYQNERYKDKAESWGNKGAEIMAALSSDGSDDSYEFEYHEIPFGTEDTIYGFSTMDEYTVEMNFNMSHKDGKSISIDLKGKTNTMIANKEFILEWLTQFYVVK